MICKSIVNKILCICKTVSRNAQIKLCDVLNQTLYPILSLDFSFTIPGFNGFSFIVKLFTLT